MVFIFFNRLKTNTGKEPSSLEPSQLLSEETDALSPAAQSPSADRPERIPDAPAENAAPPAEQSGEKNRGFLREAAQLCALPAALLYMELIARCYFFAELGGSGFGTMTAAALFLGFAVTAPLMLLRGKPRRIALCIVTALLGFLFSFYTVYYRYFHMVFSWRMAGQAMDAVQFWRDVLVMIGSVWYLIADYFLPLALFCAVGRRLCPRGISGKKRVVSAGVALALALLPYGLLQAAMLRERAASVTDGAWAAYLFQQDSMEPSARYFGVLNSTRLEWRKMLFGAPEQQFVYQDIALPPVVSDADTQPRTYGAHCFDIDFDGASAATKYDTVRSMNRYYASVPPVSENRYTGMFEGKNLIFLTLEAFSYKVIDPAFTPTLYRMATEGFVFDDFYTSSWVGSTASGEYAPFSEKSRFSSAPAFSAVESSHAV